MIRIVGEIKPLENCGIISPEQAKVNSTAYFMKNSREN
jgi:hypothetical protein